MDIKAAEKKTSCVGQFLEKVTDFMNRHRKIRFAIDFLLTLLIMVVISAKLGFWLEGNDDNTIAYVVSGHLSETPQPSLYFANAILGFFISTLYRITSSIPWYGLFILISIFACILFPLHAAEQRCKTVGGYCLVMLVGAFTIASILKQIVFAQFTTISALLAIAGYFCLIMYRKKKAKYISFILFQLFSYLLRRASMLMVQPIGYACFVAITVGIILYQAKKEKKFTEIVKEIARQIIPIFLIVIGITGVCRCVDRLVYSTDEWENANKIEDFRCQISDFSDPPAYEEVYDILAKYDISEVEYEMLKSTRIFESDKYADAAAELVDYMKQNATEETEKLTVLQMLRYVFVDSYKEHTDIILLTLLCIIVLLASGKPWLLGVLVTYYMGKMFTWGYIFYRQRMVDRVMLPLYLSEVIFLLCIIFLFLETTGETRGKGYRTKIMAVLTTVTMSVYAFLCFQSFAQQYSECKGQKYINDLFYQTEQGIADYCNSKEDCKFIISGEITIYWRYPLLSSAYSAKDNYRFLGGWYSPSPAAMDYLQEYVSEGPLYILVTTDPNFEESTNNLLKYCEMNFGYEPHYVEAVPTIIGDSAYVYQIRE